MGVKCRTIWLDTRTATINGDRSRCIFHNLPLIQVKKRSYLKINSLVVIPSSSTTRNHLIKLVNVKYNQSSYYNSDGNAMPTLLSYNQSGAINIQNGLYRLEIPPQDILNLEIDVRDTAGRGLYDGGGVPGTIVNLLLCIVIEEAPDDE